MKKLAVSLLFIGLSTAWIHAESFGDLWNDAVNETHLTILKSATPNYFYSIGQGKSLAGVSTTLAEYRFLSADLGWIHSVVDGGTGAGIGGGSIHLDKLFRQFAPNVSDLLGLFVPRTAERFYDKLSFGFSGGWDFDRGSFIYGINSGLNFDF